MLWWGSLWLRSLITLWMLETFCWKEINQASSLNTDKIIIYLHSDLTKMASYWKESEFFLAFLLQQQICLSCLAVCVSTGQTGWRGLTQRRQQLINTENIFNRRRNLWGREQTALAIKTENTAAALHTRTVSTHSESKAVKISHWSSKVRNFEKCH